MKKIIDYILVNVMNGPENEVVERGSEGYELYGYPFVANNGGGGYAVYQPMIKYDKMKGTYSFSK